VICITAKCTKQRQWINVRENRRGNEGWTIQRNWQHWVLKTQDEDKHSKKQNTENLKDEQIGPTKNRG